MALLLMGGMASAQVNIEGNVYGGGYDGKVTDSTTVTVNGGTVGRKLTLEERKTDATGQIVRINTGNVYGGGDGTKVTDSTTLADGVKVPNFRPDAGQVLGNTNVTVRGDAVVRHAVYGGGNIASVGNCDTISSIIDTLHYQGGGVCRVTIEGNALIGPKKADLTQPTAAELGTLTQEQYIDTAFKYLGCNEGWVFGSSRGVSSDMLKHLSFADSTIVIIRGNAQVVSNVFGGGENGHVQKGTAVYVSGGVIGGVPLHGDSTGVTTDQVAYEISGGVYGNDITVNLSKQDCELNEDEYGVGRRVFRGSVFGGGKGNDFVPWYVDQQGKQLYSYTAGRVYGNTHTFISDSALIYNKVYGGGTVASVGTFNYKDPTNNPYKNITSTVDNTGCCFVDITGGQIGTDGLNNGEVYGSGLGIVGREKKEGEGDLPINQALDLAYSGCAHVTIDGGIIKSNVYGGAANGHVQDHTYVTIKQTDRSNPTTIGIEGMGGWHGNVYGGGGGTARYTENGKMHHSITSGRVFGDTHVEIDSATIYHNVYGGGAIASVGTYNHHSTTQPYVGYGHATVNVKSGTIGSNGNNNGMVFGSGRGQI
ncbi:MAG: hypothetical protein IKM79_02980, partial [Bacteroidales bacterium]|nr:hypothetical protein [Bacteroidales bacterium]